MTLLIQENGSIPLLALEGRTGTVALWPTAVAALKARDPAEQEEWLLRHAEQFSKRDADRLRNWFGAATPASEVVGPAYSEARRFES